MTTELHRIKEDAAIFKFLQDLPVVQAQAFFWNYSSRRERRKAILTKMKEVK